jgi:hypothetical protein
MFDINANHNYEYNLYLCNIDKTIICNLDYIDISYEENFLTYDTLSFEVPLEDNGWRQVDNKYFSYLQPLYLILMEIKDNDDLIKQEYFIVDSPTFSQDNGVTKKKIKCYSSDYEMNNYYLNVYTEVKVLYDVNNAYGGDGILNTMLNSIYNTWTVSYMSDSLKGVYHSFDYSSSTYRSVLDNLQEQYNCFFIFNTVNNTIAIYSAEEYGELTDIVISDENYLRSLSCDVKNSEMCSKLRVYGKNNITCVKYNPRGTIDLLDYSWFQNNGRMSQSLSTAYTAWLNLIASKQSTFQGYLTQIETLNSSLNTSNNELVALKEQLKVIEEAMDAEKINSTATTYEYSQLLSQANSKQSQISSKQSQIDSYTSQINTVNNNILTLNNQLSINTNFTLAQRQELSKMTIETKLTLDSVDDEQNLYEYAKAYMKIKNKPTTDISLDLVDIFSIQDNFIAKRYDKIKVGNFVILDCSSLNFNYEQYRITQISHKKLSNSLSITISNKDKVNTELNYLQRIFAKPVSAADDLEVKKPEYGQYTEDKYNIITRDDTISNDIAYNDVVINQRGFIGSDIGGYGSIQLKGDKLIISNNNWQDYHTLLSGNGLYLEKSDKTARIVINPNYGIQIDRNEGTSSSPIWNNTMYIDEDGNAIFAGIVRGAQIDVDTDVNVGNQINIGSQDSMTSKSINFYNYTSDTQYSTKIALDNYGVFKISHSNPISIVTSDGISMVGYNIDIASGNGTIDVIGNTSFYGSCDFSNTNISGLDLGISSTFESADGKTVHVEKGVITSIT